MFTDSTGSGYIPSGYEAEGRLIIANSDPPGQRSIYIPPGDPAKEVYRIATFKDFPLHVPINPSLFASQGFYFTGYKDRVKCFSCGQAAEDWQLGDDPTASRWHKPDCELINGCDRMNVPLFSAYGRFATTASNFPGTATSSRSQDGATTSGTARPANGQFPTRSSPAHDGRPLSPPTDSSSNRNAPSGHAAVASQSHERSSGTTDRNRDEIFPCLYPVNPHMRSLESRLQTFTDFGAVWPGHTNATPREIAEAGMFYLGERDRVKCWYCNGGLQNWERYDEPWTEHAKWFPMCEFILQQKGPDFVHSIVAQFPNLRRPTLFNPALEITRGLPRNGSSQASASRQGQSSRFHMRGPVIVDPKKEQEVRKKKVEEEMNSSELVSEAKMMGFSDGEIRTVLKRQYELNDRGFSSLEDLVDSILSSENLPQTGGEEEERQRATAPRLDPFSSASELNTETRLQAIQELEESRICKSCRKEPACFVYIPCGHLASCAECDKKLKECPICHSVIRERVRSYLA